MKNIFARNHPRLILSFAALLLFSVGIFVTTNLRALIESSNQADHTLIILNKIEEILALMTDAETGQRGFIITGDDRYLEPYYAAIAPDNGASHHLRELSRTNAEAISLQNSLIGLALGALVSFSLLLLSFYLLNREVVERRRAEAILEQLNQKLEQRVQERIAELAKVNNELRGEIAQYQQTEETLRDSEKRLRTTLDSLLEGCQIISFDWRYLYLNDAVVVQARQPREDLLGRTMMQVYPGIETTELFSILQQCMEQRISQQLENEFTFPDGSKGWFELSIQPVPEGIFILSQDITDRKWAEEQIEQQLRRLQSLRAIDLAILGTTDLQLALKTILEETKARLQVDIVQIELFNPNMLILETAAVIGNHTQEMEHVTVRIGEGVDGKAALERLTIAVPDVERIKLTGLLVPVMIAEGVQAVYSTPLIAKGILIGVLNVFFRVPFTAPQDWLDFFETLAGQAAMAIESGKAFESLQRANLALRLAYDTTIEGWSRALDLRDKETEGHTLRVTEMTMKLARAAGMTEEELVQVRRGALLHDIGKMGIPDEILLKPEELTDEELVIMRKHPTYAYELLSPIAYLRPALDIPFCHHEKWDGSGYPRGLKGEQIPLSARLFAVVDVWDALRSDRPYRPGWPEEKVLEYIRSQEGKYFDPKAVELFLRLWEENSDSKKLEAHL